MDWIYLWEIYLRTVHKTLLVDDFYYHRLEPTKLILSANNFFFAKFTVQGENTADKEKYYRSHYVDSRLL